MQLNKLTVTILGLTILLITGITHAADPEDNNAEPAPAADTAKELGPLPDPVAVVNGEPIPKSLYQTYAEQRQAQLGGTDSPEVRKTLIDELVIQELLVQEAKEQNLDEDPQVVSQMEMARRNLLATAVVRKLVSEQAPTEEAIKEEYKGLMTATPDKEYKARHILVDSEEKAKNIIEELQQGTDFSELAKTHSTDNSGAEGGDLGWFTPDMMVPPFSQAATQLEKGEYTEQPVQTPFGWHVIKLDDVRDATPPSLEEMRPQLTQMLQGRMINDYLEQLREQAEVEIK